MTSQVPMSSDILKKPSKMAIVLRLSDQDVEYLKAKDLRLVTGVKKVLRAAGHTIDLSIEPETHTRDLYHGTHKLQHVGRIAYQATVLQQAKIEEDDAILALTQELAAYKKEKEASQTHLATSTILPLPKNRREAARQQKQGPFLLSPRDTATVGPVRAAPTSAPASSDRTRAMRIALIAFLAKGEASVLQIANATNIPQAEARLQLQTMASLSGDKWRLSDKMYKELNVWKIRYTGTERKAAVDNAVRAYDRMRLSKDDKLWQMLLPKTERGQGKVLSRLHLNAPTPHVEIPTVDEVSSAANTPRAGSSGTPRGSSSTPLLVAKKGGDVMKRLLSKDPKKARAAEDAKEKKRRERLAHEAAKNEEASKKRRAEDVESRPSKKQATAKAAAKSSEFIYSSDEDTSRSMKHKTEDKAVKQTATNKTAITSTAQSSTHKRTASSLSTSSQPAARTPQLHLPPTPSSRISPPKTATRPNIPSPLGAARPRLASDVSDRSGIRPPAASTPRRRHDTVTGMEDDGTQIKQSGKLKTKSKAAEQPSRKSSTTNTQSSEAYDTSDSSISFVDTITFAQGVDLAHKFKTEYYPQYAKLYDSIADRKYKDQYVADQEYDDLHKLHARIEQLKVEIQAASQRERYGDSS